MKRGQDVEAMTRHIAGRVKAARLEAGMSMEELARPLGVTFQQIQKYEKASNRISSGSLVIISRTLAKPVAWFYEGYDIKGVGTDKLAEFFSTPYSAELARAYAGLTNPDRNMILKFAERLAGVAPE